MKKNITILIILLCMSWLMAETFHRELSLNAPSGADPKALATDGFGVLSSPGMPRLPYRTVNVLIPKDAEVTGHSVVLSGERQLSLPLPEINPAFSDGQESLDRAIPYYPSSGAVYLGVKRWGDLRYASFRLLPASIRGASYYWNDRAEISLSYSVTTRNIGTIPSTFTDGSFFINQNDLSKWYRHEQAKNYDYLVVTTNALYNAITPLVTFRQSQGLTTGFAEITTILQSSPGANSAEKLRNYLVNAYAQNNFRYLLLVGDVDIVPIAMLTPEPDGWDTVPSDFYYSDLSSIWDTDNDTRYGEYYTQAGEQDWGVDYTPEVFVGRICSNSTTICANIANRIVAFEQNNGAWKNKALLPAAYLNYQGEPETIYLETDGADFMEYEKLSSLVNMDTTTMYEQIGHVPSLPSDQPLDYDGLKNLLNTQSWGLLNWSAHGSSSSSSRKVWMQDSNSNQIPDADEMQWIGMVNRQSFDNLQNADGTVIFAASCYNGMLDGTDASLGEYSLQKKSVATLAATRTGWYKIGWKNAGWGGLSSYNHHFLENYAYHHQSVGMALAYANLLHTQVYLFGDPVDSGGIIWPELQNVYTYLLFGDPAVGYTPEATPPSAGILIWDPMQNATPELQSAFLATGNYNVVYTDKIIGEYDYLDRFAAVFCLFGDGDSAYILEPGSVEYQKLDQYLENGGSLYFEGWANWDAQDNLMSKFGISSPFNHLAYIEQLKYDVPDNTLLWDYDQQNNVTMALWPATETALPLFRTENTTHNNDVIGIYNTNGSYRTLGVSFQLAYIVNNTNDLSDLLSVILDTLGVGDTAPVSVDDPTTPPAQKSLTAYPNPFSGNLYVRSSKLADQPVRLDVFNLRGQKVRSLSIPRGETMTVWNAKDNAGKDLPSGVYILRQSTGSGSLSLKTLLIRQD